MTSQTDAAQLAGPITQVFQYGDGTFIENLSILLTGHLLLAALKSPELRILDPEAAEPMVKTVVTLPGITSLANLAPIGHGLYAVGGGEHTSFSFTKGSMKVFVVSLKASIENPGSIEGVVLKTIPVVDTSTSMLNGMDSVPSLPHIIFSHDSIGGRLFRVDTRTEEVTVASTDASFGLANNTAVPLGANGLRIRDGYLYFTNSALGIFARVRLDYEGYPTGNVEKISQLDGPITMGNAYDDFTFDRKGNAYVTLHPSSINKITPDGEQTTFAGGAVNKTFQHPTSAVLANDGRSIYVSTGGDYTSSSSGGGQVIKHPRRDSTTDHPVVRFVREAREQGVECGLLTINGAKHIHDVALKPGTTSWETEIAPAYESVSRKLAE
ncbi:hypothetical protein F4781DRAFT_431255 [Annulohypoxylon bovei var. microspora]|nr:hypothetical protein F4781DRAFT_431255 [Annulohypoxylon bovei var. microspora]